MRRVTAYRANKVLYNFLVTNSIRGKALLPSNVCHDVVEMLLYAGMNLHYVDIENDTLCADKDVILSMVQDASLLLYVHTYGCDVPTKEFFVKVKSANPNIAIVDDRCLCMPDLKMPDSDADLILYSTGQKKYVEMGLGGIGYIADGWQYEDVFVLADCKCLSNVLWQLNESELIRKINLVKRHKNSLNAIYRSLLPVEIQLPESFNGWRFNIRVTKEQKKRILQIVFAEELFVSGHYDSLGIHCPVADKLSAEILNLFNDFYYSEAQAQKTCQIINQVIML